MSYTTETRRAAADYHARKLEAVNATRRMGINVRSTNLARYALDLVHGRKLWETRDTDSLRPYVGQRVGIIETAARRRPQLVGFVTLGEPVFMTAQAFRELRHEHLVPEGDAFDIRPHQRGKWCYPITDPLALFKPRPVTSHGIVARQL